MRRRRLLQKAASVLAEAEASESFRNTLREGIRNGLSFPAARAKALEMQENGIGELFTLPNNILGIEYCHALLHLNSPVRPVTVLRKGAGYHEETLHDEQNEAPGFSSAFAIRQALQQGGSFDTVRGSLPEETLEIWKYCLKNGGIVSEKDFSPLLRYRLLMEAENGFSSYADVTPDFSDRLKKNLDQFTGWHEFCLLQNSQGYDLYPNQPLSVPHPSRTVTGKAGRKQTYGFFLLCPSPWFPQKRPLRCSRPLNRIPPFLFFPNWQMPGSSFLPLPQACWRKT